MHQQLLQLVTVIQERYILEGNLRFVKSIRHLKRLDKRLDEGAQRLKKTIEIVSQQGIKDPYTMVNLVWANAYISGYVMHDSVFTIVCNA